MKLTIEDRSTRIETSSSAALSTINLTRNARGSDRCLHGERPATNQMNHGEIFATLYVYVSSEQICLSKHRRGFTPSPLKAAVAIKICTEALNSFGSSVCHLEF